MRQSLLAVALTVATSAAAAAPDMGAQIVRVPFADRATVAAVGP